MERISIPKRALQAIFYLCGWGCIVGLLLWIFDKECDADTKVHIWQSLILTGLSIVVCGVGFAFAVVSIVFGIIALVKGNAPILPWIGPKLQEAANK